MRNLVKAELLKARGTRSVWALAAVTVVFCVIWAAVEVLVFKGSTEDAYSMAQQGYVFAMILGVVLAAGEHRHQTIAWVLLVTPRRSQVVTAKLLACGGIGLLLGIAAVVVTAPVTAALLAVTDRPVFSASIPAALLGSVLSTALWSLFGAALGILLRNQLAGIIAAFVWSFYAEWLLVLLLPSVGRWTLTGLSKAAAGWNRTGLSVQGDLLPAWAASLVFLGYAIVIALAARLISVRRDIT
jgi:ABC-type transport system involved in multi-copper enzyme maturation permease subunit